MDGFHPAFNLQAINPINHVWNIFDHTHVHGDIEYSSGTCPLILLRSWPNGISSESYFQRQGWEQPPRLASRSNMCGWKGVNVRNRKLHGSHERRLRSQDRYAYGSLPTLHGYLTGQDDTGVKTIFFPEMEGLHLVTEACVDKWISRSGA